VRDMGEICGAYSGDTAEISGRYRRLPDGGRGLALTLALKPSPDPNPGPSPDPKPEPGPSPGPDPAQASPARAVERLVSEHLVPHLPPLACCDPDDFRNYKLYTPEVRARVRVRVRATSSSRNS
jgi:hypothetical protein